MAQFSYAIWSLRIAGEALLTMTLASSLGNRGLGVGLEALFQNEIHGGMHSRSFILNDFALVDDGFNFPNIGKRRFA